MLKRADAVHPQTPGIRVEIQEPRDAQGLCLEQPGKPWWMG